MTAQQPPDRIPWMIGDDEAQFVYVVIDEVAELTTGTELEPALRAFIEEIVRQGRHNGIAPPDDSDSADHLLRLRYQVVVIEETPAVLSDPGVRATLADMFPGDVARDFFARLREQGDARRPYLMDDRDADQP